MLLQGKKILIMGIRNKWSIAWGAAQSAYEQGAQVIFTCGSMEKMDKINFQNKIMVINYNDKHKNLTFKFN